MQQLLLELLHLVRHEDETPWMWFLHLHPLHDALNQQTLHRAVILFVEDTRHQLNEEHCYQVGEPDLVEDASDE